MIRWFLLGIALILALFAFVFVVIWLVGLAALLIGSAFAAL